MFNPGTYKRTPLQVALRRRQQAINSIGVHERGIANLRARIVELDAEINALGGPPKPRTAVIDFRSKGEMQRTMFEMLRERGEITAKDLAERMIAAYGLDGSNREIVHAVRQRCIQCLKRNEKAGRVRCVGGVGKGGRFKRWALVFPG